MSLPPAAPAHPATVPFAARLERYGDRPALLTVDGTLTYRDLAQRVGQAAAGLGTTRRLVLVTGANTVEALTTYLGALAAGHPVLLVPGDNPAHLDGLVARYDPDVVARASAAGWTVTERRPGTCHGLHPDLALLLTTSGSTGSPKLVRLSHANLSANAEAIAQYLAIDADDRAITTLPMHYCYGLSVVHSHLLRGAGLVLTELSVVDACFWDLFRSARATSLAGVPYTFELLDRVGFERMRLPSLRYLTQAGGRMPADRVSRYAALGRACGWDLVVMYGQTEATARIAYLPPEQALERPDAIGVPIPGGALSLEPVDGRPEPDVGELVYSGPNVMLGYAESAGDLALGRTVDALHTGDLARRAPDGLFEIVGRRSRFAKIFGLRVDLNHVERVLERNGVRALCVGTDGELVVAVESAVDPAAVLTLLARQVGLPGPVVRVRRVQELPRLASGKPDYAGVSRVAMAVPPGGEGATGTAVDEAAEGTADLCALYSRLLGRDDVTEDCTFVSLGGDSLSYVEMSVRLEAALGHLPADWHTTAIRDLAPRSAGRRRRGWRQVETNVLLRAAAIVAIVGSHANVFTILGGAHLLLMLAGLNFARFHLPGRDRAARVRHLLTSTARVAVPSIAWLALVAVTVGTYGPVNVLLLNSLLGPDSWSEPEWYLWFIEALVYTLLALTLLLAVPAVDRLERRRPFGVALAAVGVGLLTRYDLVDLGSGDRIHTASVVFWLFALGWAAGRAATLRQRLVVTGLTLATVPGFFDDVPRAAVVMAGGLALIWVPTLRVPAPAARLAGVLAGASLFIYLTHWQFYPYLEHRLPVLAMLGSLLLGVGVWLAAGRLGGAVLRIWSRAPSAARRLCGHDRPVRGVRPAAERRRARGDGRHVPTRPAQRPVTADVGGTGRDR